MTRTPLHKIVSLAACLLGAALTMGSSCLDPCEQLAQKICSCEPTQAERDSCTREATLQKNQIQLSTEERLRCTDYLRQCECRDIRNGEIQNCGLSRE